MPLAPGDLLGPYEILAPIGKGGMGEVWKARDTRLNRDVAIKTSATQFSERFEREARAIASLNHPNICTLHDVGPNYLVMEFVEGEPLKGPLPLDKALHYARQIASALEAAHEKAITHRDLKPGNILVTADGVVKVLDFGLAKIGEPTRSDSNAENSPTLTMGATVAGTILGTAAYMAPEQARGKTVDKRADIWAFGVVLYEIVTGERLFKGEDITETLAAVVMREPDLGKVPHEVRRLLKKCLQKDPKKRLHDIADVWDYLDGAEPTPPVQVPRASKLPWTATAAMTALAAVGLWGWLKPAPAEPRPITHFVAATPQGLGLSVIAVSPDGSRIAFPSASFERIYLRTMDDPLAKPIPGTEGGRFPVFSPDGQWLAFYTGTGAYQLKKVPLAGGAALTLATGVTAQPTDWSEDGHLLLPGQAILRVPESGGQPVAVAKVDRAKGEIQFISPQLLPGGAHILAEVLTTKGGVNDFPILAVDAKTGERRVLLESAGEARFVPSGSQSGIGHLVYARNGSLFAAPFDAGSLKVGPAVPVLEGMRNLGGILNAGFSRTGTLAYPSGAALITARDPATLTWVDRQGTEQPVSGPPRGYQSPRISPDGGRVAFGILEAGQTIDRHLWLLDLMRGTTSRLTFERANGAPEWTPDSRRLIYTSAANVLGARGLLASLATDGSGQPVTLIEEGNPAPTPTSISPDGKFVIGTRGNDVWVLPLGGDPKTAKPQPFLDNRFARAEFQFSPDGKWVAYQSNESGRDEVYLSPFPGPGGKFQVSTEGGTQPRWNRNGRELFFRSGEKMMAVDTELAPTFRAGTPKMLFEKVSSDYDVHPDGKRFLMLKPAATTVDSSELHVILNWFEDLRRKVPLEK